MATVKQLVITQDSTDKSSALTIPFDATLPQSGEGTAYTELDTIITPLSATSTLLIEVDLKVSANAIQGGVFALFKDSDADALSVSATTLGGGSWGSDVTIVYKMTSGTTSPITFKVRFGNNGGANTIYLNRTGISNLFLGALLSSMKIYEYE